MHHGKPLKSSTWRMATGGQDGTGGVCVCVCVYVTEGRETLGGSHIPLPVGHAKSYTLPPFSHPWGWSGFSP